MPGFELIGDEERAAVNAVFDDGGIFFAHGFDAMRNGRYRVREFEREFADWLGVKHAQCVSSGTAALKVALKALGVGPGDEVITQAHTFVASAEAIADCGARPVLVNVDDTLNMDPAEFEKAIGPNTKAVMPVHMLGVACDMEAIGRIAAERGIAVIEDNCESLGAEWAGAKLGTQGTNAAFSLDMGKVITCGEGGIVTTNDDEVHALAAEYHDHGHENNPDLPRGRDSRRIMGFNYRMTELQAAVASAQLKKLDGLVGANRRNYATLAEHVDGIDGLVMRPIPESCTPLCDTLIFSLPDTDAATRFVAGMGERGLGTKNIPDAIEWHFAGTWTHMCDAFELTPDELRDVTDASWQRLSRSVAVPVMVLESEQSLAERGGKLREIAQSVLG